MSYIEIIVNNCIYLLCPLALYLLYTSYQKNLDQEQNTLMFEVAVISSLYFVLRYGLPIHESYPTMLFDIPLLLCLFKRKTNFSIFISIILVLYQAFFLHIHPLFVFIEYLSYFLVYYYLKKREITILRLIHCFIVIYSFFLSAKLFLFINPTGSYEENITYLICIIFILYFVANLVLYFFKQGEKIVDLHTDLYNIEKEKELRFSLFKVTHEIKNPIAVCKGYLDMLDLDDKKKVHKYIPIVKEEINRTLTLMDDFLDYTKIKIQKEEIDLIMLLEEIEESLASLFHCENIACTLNTLEEEIYLDADYNRLKQVFINLLKNAIEAKDPSKEKMIVTITVEDKERDVVIFVQDNGVGMDEEECKKVCEMFFTTKEKGTGLGTSLSKEIIELHSGTMEYISKKKEETTVKITLPKKLVSSS